MIRRFIGSLLALGAIVPSIEADCDRAVIQEFADAYVTAIEAGSPDGLATLSTDFSYIENNKTADIATGILSEAVVIDHRHTIVDEVDCSSFTELISTTGPYVIGAQIRHQPEDLSVRLMDVIVSTTGHWLFNVSNTLYWAERESWAEIAPEARDTRERLRTAADAYLDMWHNKSAIDAVPWGTPCARLEGGAYTGNGSPTDSCQPGIPTNNSQAPNSHRRYVIDPSFGSISVLCIFEHLQMAPDSHEFRLEGGKVRYIHTMTLASGFGRRWIG
ncbi:hypothetical protein F4778DRAFT_719247 [Xylariomycetidae sp. FL2044]|nr:hypothetical protein F4778DRAFT_719247 [Xylariomycetidae sp. FL2044]